MDEPDVIEPEKPEDLDDETDICICPEIFAPVICDDGFEYDNQCFATCEG